MNKPFNNCIINGRYIFTNKFDVILCKIYKVTICYTVDN